MNAAKGITVNELLMTITVLAVLASLAIPSYHHVMSRMESFRVERQLREFFGYGRSKAFLESNRIAICPTIDYQRCANQKNWDQGILVFHDHKNRNRVFDEGEKLLYKHQFNLKYGSLQWRGFGVNGNMIFHDRHINLTGSNGSFYYCNPQTPQLSKRIIISPTGLIRVESGTKC